MIKEAKVLFVTHYSSLYGANKSLLALLDGIVQNKIKPYVLIPNEGDMVEELKKRDITYCIFSFKNWMAPSRMKAPFRLIMNLISLPLLLKKIRQWNIDLIYTNSSVTPIGAWLAYLLRLPHVWHVREFGWEDYKLMYDLGRKQFEYWLNKTDHIISVSKAIDDKVLKNVTTPSTVIYNGVISRKKAKKIQFKTNNNTLKTAFGIIGLLSPAKGQDKAIRAFSKVNRKYPDTELLIAGSGSKEYEIFLVNLVSELQLQERVSFLGYVDEPFDFYPKINVALVCSENEGMGRVTAEAMIAGKVVIGLDNAGTSELIEHNRTGLLYEGDIESLESKMIFSIERDLQELAKNARKFGFQNFTIENYACKVQGIFNSVTK